MTLKLKFKKILKCPVDFKYLHKATFIRAVLDKKKLYVPKMEY